MSGRLFWSLTILAVFFFVSLARFGYQLFRNLSGARPSRTPGSFRSADIPPEDLSAWVDSVAKPPTEDWDEEIT